MTTRNDVIRAFKVFDPENNGYITQDELTYILTVIGKGMTSEDAAKVLNEIGSDSRGRVYYMELVDHAMPKQPPLVASKSEATGASRSASQRTESESSITE